MIDVSKRTGFDRIFISVGDPGQKRIMESLQPYYEKKYNTAFFVVPDDESGVRIGSGGALLKLLNRYGGTDNFCCGKTLVVLSGGLSKRAPVVSLRGKLLAPLGIAPDGAPVCMIDRILKNAFSFADNMTSGLLVCCGDILVDPADLTVEMRESTAVCVYADLSVGSRHGVMFSDPAGLLNDYLQKAPESVLSEYADRYGMKNRVPVDAGWIYLSSDYLCRLSGISGVLLDLIGTDHWECNLFTDLLPVNAKNTEEQTFLQSGNTAGRRVVWDALRDRTVRVVVFDQPFLHFGTAGEILENGRFLYPFRSSALINSRVAGEALVENGTVLENVLLGGSSVIGAGCLIADIELRSVSVPARTCVFGVRLTDGRYVACVQQIEEDPSSAGRAALAAWEQALYYPSSSFTESYLLYQRRADGETYSLAQIFKNADAQFFLDWRQYLADLLQNVSAELPVYAEYRERILADHNGKRNPLRQLRCVTDRVCVELPVRINFSGTWTDCMPYCIENGGEVINAAVKVNGRLPIRVVAEKIPMRQIEMCNADSAHAAEIFDADGDMPALSECNLHRAVFHTLGVNKETVLENGIRLTVGVSGISKGSGLGTSSILLYGCFLALSGLLGLDLSEQDVLQYVFVAEQLMHTGGGWQDQGAMIGTGIKRVFAAPGLPQKTEVERLPCSRDFLRALSSRMVLIPTGQRHFGRFIVTDVMNRYLSRNAQTEKAFSAIAELNDRLKKTVAAEDMSEIGACMNLHAKYLDLLSPLVYNNIIKQIERKCMPFACGCSICGAGGGGYLAVLLKEGVSVALLRDAMQTEILSVEIL